MPVQIELNLSFARTACRSWLVDCLCTGPCADCCDSREDPNRRLDWGDRPASEVSLGIALLDHLPPQPASLPCKLGAGAEVQRDTIIVRPAPGVTVTIRRAAGG